MITRAWGIINGSEVTFTQQDSSDIWTVDVPRVEDGVYAVEINAENDAGLTAYLCTVLFVISGHKLRCHLIPRGYEAVLTEHDFKALLMNNDFEAVLRKNRFESVLTDHGFEIASEKCEYSATLKEDC